MLRGNGGANSLSLLDHRGTGEFQIKTEEAAPIVFKTTATERMRITSDGKVGIGTVLPNGPLHVKSNNAIVEIESSGNLQNSAIGFTTTTDARYEIGTNISGGTNFELYDRIAGTARISFMQGGNVGIGTLTPVAKFEVAGSLKVTSYTSSIGASPGVSLGYNSASNIALLETWGSKPLKINTYGYQAFSTNDVEKMRLTQAGDLGIGTTSPQEKLHVVGLQGSVPLSSYYGSLVVDNNGEAAISIIGNSYSSIYFGDAATNFAGAVVYNHSANAMEFRTTTNAEKMRITSDGTVIIGAPSSAYNTTQGYSFHAVADYTAQSYISIARKGQTSGSQGMVIGLDTGNAYIQVRDNINLILGTNNQGQQWIQPNGNVGIGVSGPNSRLSVAGVIQNKDAYADPSFTVTSVGMSVVGSGSIQFTQGWAGTSAAGDTVVFRYNAASWKSWNLDYTFSSTNGMVKGTIGGYNNNSGGGSNAFLKNDFSITCVGTNVGQSVVVTFTGNFGIHMNCNMRYSQGGGDGAPQSTRAFLTYNS